ncbi:helix-turn-helix transcriptional regulator [Ilyomonas limi]|uniref:Helix-turn-helix transcriptional regulator n=1 Tax=Ilyomonas limi TaxID=2575867 RepID=A0A4U3KYU3_9BACT|nr:AraC family transcriptional regulator [Ilyomonas limi]TKK66297.1 helix-turn-helix transcriptional regulator [Ilyomonas limi]
MRLFIKNMVCPRCIIAVKQLLEQLGLKAKSVFLGEVELYGKPNEEQFQKLNEALSKIGFELLSEPNQQIVDKIKTLIIQKVQSSSIEPHFLLSTYLKSNLLKDYSTLTKIFSEVEGDTVEKYFILQKIEKAKELLLYRQMTKKEIATSLGYSSCQHFSMQFKKMTGYSPRDIKKYGFKDRRSIDNVTSKISV